MHIAAFASRDFRGNQRRKASMKVHPILALPLALISLSLTSCNRETEAHQEEHSKIVATSPQVTAVTITERYVCQIHSQRHIKVRALEQGYLEAIPVREGQGVKAEDVLFKVKPVLYQARFDS